MKHTSSSDSGNFSNLAVQLGYNEAHPAVSDSRSFDLPSTGSQLGFLGGTVKNFVGQPTGTGGDEDPSVSETDASSEAARNNETYLRPVRHSVLYIGIDTDVSGKRWFLMRNTWKNMPLFLASAQCLTSTGASYVCFKEDCSIGKPPTRTMVTDNVYTACSSPFVDHMGQESVRDSNFIC